MDDESPAILLYFLVLAKDRLMLSSVDQFKLLGVGLQKSVIFRVELSLSDFGGSRSGESPSSSSMESLSLLSGDEYALWSFLLILLCSGGFDTFSAVVLWKKFQARVLDSLSVPPLFFPYVFVTAVLATGSIVGESAF